MKQTFVFSLGNTPFCALHAGFKLEGTDENGYILKYEV